MPPRGRPRIPRPFRTRSRIVGLALALLAAIAVAGLPAETARATNSFDNAAIADQALTHLGQPGGQCKQFANDMVSAASGGTVGIGGGYYAPFSNAGGTLVSASNAAKGDIIQLNKMSDAETYYNGMHTAIVVSYLGNNTFDVVDSNWGTPLNNEIVHHHNWNPYSWAATYGLTVNVWRLGTVMSGGGGGSANPNNSMGVDVNGDGRDDLLWYQGTTLNSIGATGAPGWTLGAWQKTNTLGSPTWAGVGNLDYGRLASPPDPPDYGDDLWWYQNGTLHVFGSKADHSFGQWDKSFTMGAPDWAAAADVNADGLDDLLWYQGTTLQVIGATGSPSWTLGAWQESNAGLGAPEWAGVGDLNCDRKDDLWWYVDGTIHIYGPMQVAGGGWKFGAWEEPINNMSDPTWAAAADVDGDGCDDLLWYDGSQQKLTTIGSTGSTLGAWQKETAPLGSPTWAGVGDLDYGRTASPPNPPDYGDDLWWYQNGVLHVLGSKADHTFGLWDKPFTMGGPSWAGFGSYPNTNGDGMP